MLGHRFASISCRGSIAAAQCSRRCLATSAAPAPNKAVNKSVAVGVLLKRNPIVLPALSPFEQEYLQYRDGRLLDDACGFSEEFYFRKGSTKAQQWVETQQKAVEEKGHFDKLREGLHAKREKLVEQYTNEEEPKAKEQLKSSIEKLDQQLSETASPHTDLTPSTRTRLQMPLDNEVIRYKFNARTTEADRKGDMKSLDRKLDQSLYLLVKLAQKKGGAAGEWVLPESTVQDTECLHEAAPRTLREHIGTHTETWVVGKTPVGYIPKAKSNASVSAFFMKMHLFAGRPEPRSDLIQDYMFVTQAEMKEHVKPEYFQCIEPMLSEI